jgi:hypothetical protein
MDLTPPPAPLNVSLAPDTGVSNADRLTRERILQVQGELGEDGLSVFARDLNSGRDLGRLPVTERSFAGSIEVEAGRRRIQVRAADAAGNTADTVFEFEVDRQPPYVLDLDGLEEVTRTTVVRAFEVVLSEDADPSVFPDAEDFILRWEGGDDRVPPDGLGFEWVGPRRLRVTGLATVTRDAGTYEIRVVPRGVLDAAGNPGEEAFTRRWALAPNRLPNVADDLFQVAASSEPVLLDVLANDDDEDGDLLEVGSVQPPSHGQALIVEGRLYFVSGTTNFGRETMLYTAVDEKGGETQGSITVTVPFDLMLSTGWNLVGMPVEPDVPELRELFGGVAVRLPAWAFGEQGYEGASRAESGAAFWLYLEPSARREATLQVLGNTAQTDWDDLGTGWNLFSTAHEQPVPETANAVGPVWWWDAAEGHYRHQPPDRPLIPGIAYWILVR